MKCPKCGAEGIENCTISSPNPKVKTFYQCQNCKETVDWKPTIQWGVWEAHYKTDPSFDPDWRKYMVGDWSAFMKDIERPVRGWTADGIFVDENPNITEEALQRISDQVKAKIRALEIDAFMTGRKGKDDRT